MRSVQKQVACLTAGLMMLLLSGCGKTEIPVAEIPVAGKPTLTHAQEFNTKNAPDLVSSLKVFFGPEHARLEVRNADLDSIRVSADSELKTVHFEMDIVTNTKNVSAFGEDVDCIQDPATNYIGWMVWALQSEGSFYAPTDGFIFTLHWVNYIGSLKTDKFGNSDTSGVKRVEYASDQIGVSIHDYQNISSWVSADYYALQDDSIAPRIRHSKSFERGCHL